MKLLLFHLVIGAVKFVIYLIKDSYQKPFAVKDVINTTAY